MSEDDRRQFPRLELSEDAFAVDEKDGSQLGRVAEAGGGGFLIYPATPDAIKKLSVGNRLRITVKEPRSKAASTAKRAVSSPRENDHDCHCNPRGVRLRRNPTTTSITRLKPRLNTIQSTAPG